MKTYTIQIELKSDALIGSGEGFGTIIDSDIVFDDVGIPYIPAKRIKGCLKDSAEEVCKMLNSASIPMPLSDSEINKTFGKPGEKEPAPVYFSNLTIDDCEDNRQWLKYLSNKYSSIISREGILSTFAYTRQQTAIDEKGVADGHSLRTVRVIKKGNIFKGEVHVEDEIAVKLIALACHNLRRIGTKRNRGFGEIECILYDGTNEIPVLDELEALCTK